jgi:peptide/nickel transport system permease protein
MTRFLIRRILSGIVVLWIVSTSAFFLFFTRNPIIVARSLAGRAATGQILAEVERNLGLTQPILVQYWQFLKRTVTGNFGLSYYNGGIPVSTILARDIPRTLSVVVGGVALWLIVGIVVGVLSATRARSLFDRLSTVGVLAGIIVGIVVGVLSATRARSLFDRLSTVGVLAGISLPTFVLGELLLAWVFVPLNTHGFTWVNTGYAGLSQGLFVWSGSMILPWITLATVQAAIYTRLSRGSLLDTLGEDYIRTARAKGLTERRIVYRHGMRSALTPVVSQLGVDIGAFLGGVLVVETVFGIGGLGQDAVGAVANGDLPTIIAFVLLAALFVVVANIIVDIVYAVLDPRVRIT